MSDDKIYSGDRAAVRHPQNEKIGVYMKKIVSLIAALSLLFAVSCSSGGGKTVMSLGNAKIDEATRCRYGAPTVIIGAYDAGVSAKGLGYETGDFGDIDTSIVLTNIANAAAAENIGSCWVGAYDSAIIRKNFNIPNNYVLVDLMMVGHSAEDAEPSPRHEQTEPLDTLVVRETF